MSHAKQGRTGPPFPQILSYRQGRTNADTALRLPHDSGTHKNPARFPRCRPLVSARFLSKSPPNGCGFRKPGLIQAPATVSVPNSAHASESTSCEEHFLLIPEPGLPAPLRKVQKDTRRSSPELPVAWHSSLAPYSAIF